MATHSALYKAPFGPGGASEVDTQLAEKLLSGALARGQRKEVRWALLKNLEDLNKIPAAPPNAWKRSPGRDMAGV